MKPRFRITVNNKTNHISVGLCIKTPWNDGPQHLGFIDEKGAWNEYPMNLMHTYRPKEMVGKTIMESACL